MEPGSPYSPLKVFHHPERLQKLREGKQPAPLQVQLIISDLCNQDCSFCAYRMSGYTSNQLFTKDAELAKTGHNNPKRMIPFDKVVEILDDCVELGVKAIQLTGGGEPTAHPRFYDICREILDRKLDLGLVTNGVNLKATDLLMLTEAKWVRFSVDAGRPLTYCRVRNVPERHYHKVWGNIRDLCQARDHQQSHDLLVGVGFVVTKDNWSEVGRCGLQAKQAGADNLRISAVFQSDGPSYFRDFHKEAAEDCRLAERMLTSDTFKVFNLFGERLDDLLQHGPDYRFCGYQHLHTYIGGDLNVYRCCNLAYNERGLVGSLKGQRFKELWRSRAKEKLFGEFDARGCERCQFNNKNRTILYAISDQPRHVNFV